MVALAAFDAGGLGDNGAAEARGGPGVDESAAAPKLEGHFEVLYTGESGLVAHECSIDLRG